MHHVLMSNSTFEVRQFPKTQSEIHSFELFLKVQISLDHPKSNTNKSGICYVHALFCVFYTAFNGIFQHILFANFSKPMEFLSHTRGIFYVLRTRLYLLCISLKKVQ